MKNIITVIAALSTLFVGFSAQAAQSGKASSEVKSIKLIRGEPVVTSPFMGERSYFDSFDYIVNVGQANQDLRFLEQLYKIQNIYTSQGLEYPTTPMMDLSGSVEVQGSSKKPYKGGAVTDLDLITAQLHTLVRLNAWGNAFLSTAFDNGSSSAETRKVDSSRIYLEQGFLTLGNLHQSPFYFTAGQLYMPFGAHASYMLTSALPSTIGKLKERAVIVGFKHGMNQGIHIAAFGFKGGIKGTNQGGAQIDFLFSESSVKGKVGAGIVSQLAETNRFVATGATGNAFKGFKANDTISRVPGLNFHGNAALGDFELMAELTMATKAFQLGNLMFQNKGAKPLALHIEGEYNLKNLISAPVGVALGYGYSKEALALNLPEHRIAASATMAFWPSTLQAIELRHDINYRKGNVASGQNFASDVTQLGRSSTALTVQIGYYF